MKAIKVFLKVFFQWWKKNIEWLMVPMGVILFYWSRPFFLHLDENSFPYDLAILQKFILAIVGMFLAVGIANIILWFKSREAWRFLDLILDKKENGLTTWQRTLLSLVLYLGLLLTFALILRAM